MTVEEYNKLPIGNPEKNEIGQRYRLGKSDREYKPGDRVWCFEVIRLTGFGHEAQQVDLILE